ncbi:hypothetical protein F511_25246 [Dorcoceras hygrometricum]|uniref:DUF7722 domain-containing protein n=1 Tax=Dorcoceras hygrometricum TaxID=472368 RepID=A0A2Z7C0Q1_9LAMI|nr:hypothetical protein F511_25246 [Dorcoceras hygrometricum]
MNRGILESISRWLSTNVAATATATYAPVRYDANEQLTGEIHGFQMPLHYPRYARPAYEVMPEWKLNCLLCLQVSGDVDQKRKFAMGAFLWNS